MIRQGMAVALVALAISGCEQPAADTERAPPTEAVAPNAPTASVQPVTTDAANLGVTFDPGPGLTMGPCEGNGPQCIAVSDPAAEPYVRDLLTVEVHDGPLEAVAAEEAGFVRNAEGRLMTTYGRFEPVPAEAFTVHGNPGLRATITCGTSDPETGFHAAAGECVWAVVSDGSRSAVIVSSGYENAIDPANAVIASIRFLPRP